MNGWAIFWLIVILVLALRLALFAYRTVTGTRRWAHGTRRQPRLRHVIRTPLRPGNKRLHAASRDAARDLVLTLLGHKPPHGGRLPPGLVPVPDERSLQQVTAGYAAWGTMTTPAGGLKVNMLAIRLRIRGHLAIGTGWVSYGHAGWLITTQRAAALLPGDKHPTSIWWNSITAITTGPRADTLILEAGDGWRGIFYGPAIAPLTVAAIAHRYGLHALATEPALAWLRDQPTGGQQ